MKVGKHGAPDLRLPWADGGLCAQVGSFLFDEVGEPDLVRQKRGRRSESYSRAEKRRAEARRLCQVCPALDACATHVMTSGESYGVWAGLSSKQRQRIANSNPELQARLDAIATVLGGTPVALGSLSTEQHRESRIRRATVASEMLQASEAAADALTATVGGPVLDMDLPAVDCADESPQTPRRPMARAS